MRINIDGREKLKELKARKEPVVPLPGRTAKVSISRVAEILRIDEKIVRNFFINTSDHKKYPFDGPLEALFKMKNHQIYFKEEMLLVWFDMHYVGMKELYYSRKQAWLRARQQ